MAITEKPLPSSRQPFKRSKIEENILTVGITDHAQRELGDVVYLELPEIGAAIKKEEPFGEIEAVKTVASLYAPVSGIIIDVNKALADNAEAVNNDPYGAGWIVKIEMSDTSEGDNLLSAASYKKLI